MAKRRRIPASDFIIYGLTDPCGAVRYVGLSKVGLLRARQHGYPSAVARQRPCACWIRSLRARGEEFGVVVLERCASVAELPAAEQRWIATLRRGGAALLNCTDGGEGLLNPTPEVRAQMSASRTGKKVKRSQEWRENVKAAAKGRNFTEAARRAHDEALTGKPLTEEHRAALRAAKARQRAEGRLTRSPETRAKVAEAARRQWERQSRPILDETTGITYPSQRAAAAAIGVTPNMIGHVLRGKARAARGHRLRFVDRDRNAA